MLVPKSRSSCLHPILEYNRLHEVNSYFSKLLYNITFTKSSYSKFRCWVKVSFRRGCNSVSRHTINQNNLSIRDVILYKIGCAQLSNVPWKRISCVNLIKTFWKLVVQFLDKYGIYECMCQLRKIIKKDLRFFDTCVIFSLW